MLLLNTYFILTYLLVVWIFPSLDTRFVRFSMTGTASYLSLYAWSVQTYNCSQRRSSMNVWCWKKEWQIQHRDLNKWRNLSLKVAHWGKSHCVSGITWGCFCRRWRNHAKIPASQELAVSLGSCSAESRGTVGSWLGCEIVKDIGPLLCLCYSSSSWAGLEWGLQSCWDSIVHLGAQFRILWSPG